MSTGRTERLVVAINSNDIAAIADLGWTQIIADLESVTIWSKKSGRLTTADLVNYARVLGHHTPADVAQAVINHAASGDGEWRPAAAHLASIVVAHVGQPRQPRRPAGQQKHRADNHPITLARVAELVARGATECACHQPSNYRIGAGGVIRCAECHGIDPGQIDQALEEAPPATEEAA